MNRRKFIKNSASFLSLPIFLNGTALQVIEANGTFSDESTNGKKLVLIQLDGGNDGLNTLIPLDVYDNLVKIRPHVIIPENKIIKLSNENGIHPSMEKIKYLFDDEKFMFIQNVGYPQPNLSHFRSKEIVLSASDSQTVISSGWFGRFLEMQHPEYPENYPSQQNPHPLAITIGNSSSPTCQGEVNNLGVVLQNLNTSYNSESENQTFPDSPYGYELKYVSGIMQKTEKYLEVVSGAADKSSILSSKWPDENKFADKLQIVARLIAGGLNTPVYVVNLGGFDTHANQVVNGEPEKGKHADLLKELSEAIYAFQFEMFLQKKEDDVLGMVYSEFGRRIASNKSNGTDHGAAYPMMLFGSRVNSVVYGKNPEISENTDNKQNLHMEFDFRSVYASVLKHWFELETQQISDILLKDFEFLPILKSSVTSDKIAYSDSAQLLPVYPNPIQKNATISFSTIGGLAEFELWNANVRYVRKLKSKKYIAGKHTFQFNRTNETSGNYFIILKTNNKRFTQPIVLK